MSFSASPVAIVGVKASEIIDMKVDKKSFDKHDERGNKTGETGTDIKITLSATVEGKKVSDTNKKLYNDSVASLLDLPEVYNKEDKNKFGVFTLNSCRDREDIDSDIVGMIVLSTGDMTEVDSAEEVSINSAFTIVRQNIKGKYGVDVKPQLFLYGNGSY